jgi:hypothetical protein
MRRIAGYTEVRQQHLVDNSDPHRRRLDVTPTGLLAVSNPNTVTHLVLNLPDDDDQPLPSQVLRNLTALRTLELHFHGRLFLDTHTAELVSSIPWGRVVSLTLRGHLPSDVSGLLTGPHALAHLAVLPYRTPPESDTRKLFEILAEAAKNPRTLDKLHLRLPGSMFGHALSTVPDDVVFTRMPVQDIDVVSAWTPVPLLPSASRMVLEFQHADLIDDTRTDARRCVCPSAPCTRKRTPSA